MNEEYYRIDTATKFYLYGVNYQAKKILHNLIRNGFTVDAIIDRNVNQNNILDAKIISIEMLNDRILGKVNYCIIICLQNALQHDSVVKKLLEYGFSQIIFLPINFNLSDKKANILRKLFNKIIRGENILNAEIPFIHTGAILDDGIIEYSSDEFLYAWIPVELVYTNAVRVADEHVPFIDRPLSVFYPYFELYDFLEGRIEQCEDYFILQQYVKPSIQEDKWKKNILLQRQELIYIFEREFRKGMSFFIASASQAVWNKKGYFNIKDGAHRNIFLIRKGVQYLPLAISKCEYEIWMNTQYFRKYIHKLMNDIIDHPYLIEHPYLEGYNLNWEINYKIGTALEYIFLYKNIESKKIIFYGRYADYYARRINRLNIGKIYLLNEEKNSLINDNINKWLFCDSIENFIYESVDYYFDTYIDCIDEKYIDKHIKFLEKMIGQNTRNIVVIRNRIENLNYKKYVDILHKEYEKVYMGEEVNVYRKKCK